MSLVFADGRVFAASSSTVLEQLPSAPDDSAKIFARVRPNLSSTPSDEFYAMVDTGGAWTIFHHELARSLGLMELEGLPGPVLKTWMGNQTGKLVKCPLTLCADRGCELTVDATVFVSETWSGHNILGYNGLLSHLRIAFDPQQDENRWYFGDLR